MVRYTGPPADRQKGGQPPQSIYQTKTGQWRDKNLQATENKEVIRKIFVLNATPDEGDDGVGTVIDTTKVTSSTPADQPLPQPHKEQFEGVCNQDRPPQSGQAEERHPERKVIPRAQNGQCNTQSRFGRWQVVWFCYRVGKSSPSQTKQKLATY
ncbi:hypothetical protein [Aeromonas sp. 604443]|uniref:hypothetical protein n=1 Tax=Aeromonas sp. 604443 TaxID=2712054 RepID=UPI003BA11792